MGSVGKLFEEQWLMDPIELADPLWEQLPCSANFDENPRCMLLGTVSGVSHQKRNSCRPESDNDVS